MIFDETLLHTIDAQLQDEASRILFEGQLAYRESGDAQTMGLALADYFQLAPASVRSDSPELFALMDQAFAKGFSPDQAMLLSPAQLRFFSGLGAAPEPFTDIYNCYFDSGIIQLSPEEIFIDGGAQDLFTAYRFAKKARNKYKAIYAFEPDCMNYVECTANKELFDQRLQLSMLALNDKQTPVAFCEDKQNSHFDENGKTQVFSDTLDHCLAGLDPTFIKLHLEGAEYAALQGAKETIRRCKPKIAVCVDHRAEDIAAIPELLLSLCPDYRLYLRHYSSSITETILYAVL